MTSVSCDSNREVVRVMQGAKMEERWMKWEEDGEERILK